MRLLSIPAIAHPIDGLQDYCLSTICIPKPSPRLAPLCMSIRSPSASPGPGETLFLRDCTKAIAEGQLLLQMSAQAADVQLGLSWIYYTVGDMDRAYAPILRRIQGPGDIKSSTGPG